MANKRTVKCPACEGLGKVHVFSFVITGYCPDNARYHRYRIFHPAPTNSHMRCALCLGVGRVIPELQAAFYLQFSSPCSVAYVSLTKLRLAIAGRTDRAMPSLA
jgi:hypothetical protein